MGKRVIEIMVYDQEDTRRRLEVDGRKSLRDVVYEYIREVHPELLGILFPSGEPFAFIIVVGAPDGDRVVDSNITVDELIRDAGTDRIGVVLIPPLTD